MKQKESGWIKKNILILIATYRDDWQSFDLETENDNDNVNMSQVNVLQSLWAFPQFIFK